MVDAAWIDLMEQRFFRTHHDIGANLNALMVWNLVRQEVGLPKLTLDDLVLRYADSMQRDLDRFARDGVPECYDGYDIVSSYTDSIARMRCDPVAYLEWERLEEQKRVMTSWAV